MSKAKVALVMLSIQLGLLLFIFLVLYAVASPLLETRKFHDGQKVYVHDGFHIGKSGAVTQEMVLPYFGRSYEVDTNGNGNRIWIDQSELSPVHKTCEQTTHDMCDRWKDHYEAVDDLRRRTDTLRHKSWCPLPTDAAPSPSADWWKTYKE